MPESLAEDSPQPHGLQYAADGRRKRRWLRRGSVVLVLATAFVTANYFHRPIWTQVQILYWQRQCLNYDEPPGHVACEEVADNSVASEKAAVAALLRQTAYQGSAGAVASRVEALDRFDQLCPTTSQLPNAVVLFVSAPPPRSLRP
jgi:hypothetical protein